jgi:hypothetical protein
VTTLVWRRLEDQLVPAGTSGEVNRFSNHSSERDFFRLRAPEQAPLHGKRKNPLRGHRKASFKPV